LVLAGLVPYFVFAVTFSKNTTFLGNVDIGGSINSGTWSGTAVAVAKGGTGATDAATARTNLGLGTIATQNTGITSTVGLTNCTMLGSITFTSGIATASDASGSCDGDIAENYGTEELVVRGEIVALGTTVSSREFTVGVPAPGESATTPYTIVTSKVRKATFDTRVRIIGAVPTAPKLLGDDVIDPADHPEPVALVGHVPIKMTLDGGDVAIGDPITVSSSTPGYGMKANTSGRILGYALEKFTATATSSDGMIEVYVKPQDWIAPQDFNALLDLSQFGAAPTNSAVATGSFMDGFLRNLFAQVTSRFADAQNGIGDFFAANVHAQNELCINTTCVTEAELKALLAASAQPSAR
jgi:hypothetical protein